MLSLWPKKVFCFKMCVMCVFNILKVDKLRIYKSLKTYNIENPKRVKINFVYTTDCNCRPISVFFLKDILDWT